MLAREKIAFLFRHAYVSKVDNGKLRLPLTRYLYPEDVFRERIYSRTSHRGQRIQNHPLGPSSSSIFSIVEGVNYHVPFVVGRARTLKDSSFVRDGSLLRYVYIYI